MTTRILTTPVLRLPAATALLAATILTSPAAEEWKPSKEPAKVLDGARFALPEGLEATVWAQTPLLYNPTNMDIDAAGRIWVAEGVNYRGHKGRRPGGDRIVVVEDTDGDGKADTSHTFVQETGLIAPLGVAVFDNVIVVSQPPDMIVYTDVDRDRKFDPAVDKREVLLTGFNGRNHDHSLHSVTGGPDGLWYFNQGNTCALFTDKSGKQFRIGSSYNGGGGDFFTNPQDYAGQPSDDGHVYVGGFSVRMNPDGTNAQVIGHNYRNSYEQTITSFGDVFQNDNDDPPACRTSFILEYGNAGFSSADGKRSWGADKRPGQSTPVAEWRQEDPGTMPAGDVYGGGAPTGITYYENGALGDQFAGLLLSCETGKNVVFGYHPKMSGAGWELNRFNFFTSNLTGEFDGSDFTGGTKKARPDDHDAQTIFRPSDVCVGADGAVYVTDWFDARTGGHQDLDETCSGAIYRIAPKGFRPVNPAIDFTTLDGQIAAVKSPAKNVRWVGFQGLKARGAAALPAVQTLLADPGPYVSARAVWLLPHLGPDGVKEANDLLAHKDERYRIAAFRALRRAGADILAQAEVLAKDPSAAVRREAVLAMRDVPFEKAKPVLLEVARTLDADDRTLVEALGIGATGKEAEFYTAATAGAGSDAAAWSPALARIAWRAMVPAAVPANQARALAASLSADWRSLAVDALAFVRDASAVEAMVAVASGLPENDALRNKAIWWLKNRADNEWSDLNVPAAMSAAGLGDAAPMKLIPMPLAEADNVKWDTAAILAMKGDPARGKVKAQACLTCHKVGTTGVEYGPGLTGWGKSQPREVILEALISPSKTIAHGYDGTRILTKDGIEINGIVLAEGRVVTIRSTGGVEQKVPKRDIKERKALERSLMMSVGTLGLKPEDVADLIAWLQAGAE